MRLRNIPRANDVIAASPLVIQDPKAQRGLWQNVFGNDHPIHIEVGMGKGRFITDLAKKHPEINYIGIERYTSVLLRAVEKLQGKEQPEGAEQQENTRQDIPENLYFICMDATELPEVFAPGEVDRIYLNFSDPWPETVWTAGVALHDGLSAMDLKNSDRSGLLLPVQTPLEAP